MNVQVFYNIWYSRHQKCLEGNNNAWHAWALVVVVEPPFSCACVEHGLLILLISRRTYSPLVICLYVIPINTYQLFKKQEVVYGFVVWNEVGLSTLEYKKNIELEKHYGKIPGNVEWFIHSLNTHFVFSIHIQSLPISAYLSPSLSLYLPTTPLYPLITPLFSIYLFLLNHLSIFITTCRIVFHTLTIIGTARFSRHL